MFRNQTYRQQALTSQAWDNLTGAVETARHSTRLASRRAAGFVDDASRSRWLRRQRGTSTRQHWR